MNGAVVAQNGTTELQPISPTDTPRPSPASLTTLPQILSALSSLQSEESELSDSLSQLLSSQEPILDSLARVQALAPRIDDLYSEASLLSDKVSATARTAERVGGRVRTLDEEMRRVREANERVGQVMELKSSLSALQKSMESQDWESATRHCARAMALPDEVISGPFAETAVPTSESHLPPAQTLQAARDTLLDVFRRQFDEATAARDAAATTRFFKLFPAIGWEAEGLEAYAAFVVDLVKVRPPASAKTSSPLYYITSLTALFESIAMIIDQHQPVVEKYYGAGKMVNVIVRLLQECDRVAKSLTESWEEERSMKRMIANVVPSPIAASPANRRQPTQGSAVEDEVDAREIDKVISEAAGMASRWNLFRRFLYDRLREQDPDGQTVTPRGGTPVPSTQNYPEIDSKLPPPVIPEALKMVDSSACNQLFDDLLSAYYTPLEVWYTRSAIEKAHRLSTPDALSSPATTTTPDDAFYILKVVLTRLISTGSPRALERTSVLLRDVIERDYAGVIKRKMDDVYRTAGAMRGEKAERESRLSFITLLNDLDISSSHMERLIKDLVTAPTIDQGFLNEEAPIAKSSISAFNNLVPKFRSVLRSGIEQLFNQLLRPKMRTFLTDVYKDVSYVLDEDAYNQSEYQDVVRKRFVKAWEGLVEGYKDTFTEGNFRLFFGLALDILIRPWEKYIMSIRYSELGAIRLDRDLRAITTHLSSQTAFGDVREKFVRLQQISTIANLDQEEDVDEFYSSSGIPWKLTEQEARTIAGLKM
ncbi:COG4-domain-containing protein [Stereum hirsutum FP-91666 SS1]|uniref:COG4-domain-containing protein n=1 Tax=Stereum hirsutum (strain FP-91666) TaxID=721885 RepID=UPI000440EF7F|nr:COG4-domain-containing protein [Stereum hirsutum FP-91666 SS1]EIM90524.1 COG4-domain-containing protein [Stereum hirsutum FP-91666 SS1]